MSAEIIDGKQISQDIRAELKDAVAELVGQGVTPGLAVILVGEDPASCSYVTAKERACEACGIFSDDNRLPADTTQEALMALVEEKNADPAIHGILVQLPLPAHLDESAVLLAIDPDKDVDGFHPMNVGKMMVGEKAYLPCTPHGVLQLLKRSEVPVAGSHVVVVGRSNIVGKPVAALLAQKSDLGNATVTMCHTGTRDLGEHTRQADIIVAAAGRPNTVTADMIKPGAVVIDVGVTRVEDASRERGYRLVGDVDFEGAADVAGKITPVPGGVGPMTIAMLLWNTVESARSTLG